MAFNEQLYGFSHETQFGNNVLNKGFDGDELSKVVIQFNSLMGTVIENSWHDEASGPPITPTVKGKKQF